LGLAAAIDDHCPFGAETAGGADAVHGGIAPANDCHIPAPDDRGCGGRVATGFHQVNPGEEFVGRIDSFEVLPRDVEHGRQAGAVCNEDRVKIFPQLVQGEGLADDDIAVDDNAELNQAGNFHVDDL